MINGDSLLKHILVLAPLSNKEKHALDAKKVWLKALAQTWFEMWSLQGFDSWMVIESTTDEETIFRYFSCRVTARNLETKITWCRV